jgi:protocatechuate 3,4-dioxygenase, alpha subunit
MGVAVPELTPFQTAGPFLSIGLRTGIGPPSSASGEPVTVAGRLLDGVGAPVCDGVLECWQAELGAFQRVLTDQSGAFQLDVMPTPFLSVVVLGRGILTRHWTRIYFEDAEHLDSDPVMQLVPVERRPTLIARKTGPRRYHFDVVLQGERETVFFDV